ncbi:MAG TPA: DUF1064 domain-containing protein [Ignavibacteriaceae bacterium]
MFRVNYDSKYRAKSIVYNGIQYHSKREAAYAAELELRVKGKDIRAWDRQVKIDLSFNGKHIANYYIDFVLYHMDGLVEYVEVKGFETPEWKLKWKMFEALYGDKPNTRLTVVK